VETLRPGDIGFGPIGGFIPGFFPVDVGQWLLARTSDEERDIDHVFVVVQAAKTGYDLPNVMRAGTRIVQAMPSGAEEIEIGQEHWTDRYVYVRPAYLDAGVSALEAAAAARAYIGTPYSFLDYAAIALHHIDPVWRISPESVNSQPLARYIRSTGHMICSQLADQALTDAGFHVFDDGRLPQDVMPCELYRKLISLPGTLVLHPGEDASTRGWYPEV
jgi:hypothetical protein